MRLPNFPNKIDYSIEPIYKTLFYVEYYCSDISKNDSDYLQTNTHKIKRNRIYCHVNDNNKTIDILQQMDHFKLVLKTHDKMGRVFGKYIYTNCKFKNLIEDMIDFDWDDPTILLPSFEFNYEYLEYITEDNFLQYERAQKLKRILN